MFKTQKNLRIKAAREEQKKELPGPSVLALQIDVDIFKDHYKSHFCIYFEIESIYHIICKSILKSDSNPSAL